MCNNPKLDLVNKNAYIEFGENLSICFQDIKQKTEFWCTFGTKVQKMTCNNPKLDLVNMNAYMKFGKILSICPQDDDEMKFWH